MTSPPRFALRLPRASFAPRERVPLTLEVTNPGAGLLSVPDPLRGGPSLTLHLRLPSGAEEVITPGDAPPPAGTRTMLADERVVPGDTVSFPFNLGDIAPIGEPGRYTIAVAYAWAPTETWRSPELPFEIAAPAGRFLDVTPSEAAAIGHHGVLWTEAEPRGARALLFDCGVRATDLRNADEALELPVDAEPALSTAPAGQPSEDRWAAWLTESTLHARYLTSSDETPAIDAAPLVLAPTILAPRLVRPLLAEGTQGADRPRCAVGVLAANAGGGKDLHLVEIDRDGATRVVAVVAMASAVVTGWATAKASNERDFVFALESPGWVHVIAISAPWDAPCGAPAAWFVAAADGFVQGDVRASTDGQVRVGLLLRRGDDWARITFTAPAPGEAAATNVLVDTLPTPTDAEAVRVRLDAAGKLHTLYRRGRQLHYLPPGAAQPSWSDDRLGAMAAQTAHLVLRPGRGPVLVCYDADGGALFGRI